MSAGPGILHVFADPGPNVTLDEFHDWYNNEHGPDRMRLSGIKSGLRYEAIDRLSPPWLATYELDDITFLQQPVYTQLRENRSAREAGIISRMAVLDRHIYRLVVCEGQFGNESGSVSITVSLTVSATSSLELEQWYIKEHIGMLSCIPGWLRSRLLAASPSTSSNLAHYLAIHEFARSNGLNGPEHEAAKSTPWRTRVMSTLVVNSPNRRSYRLHRVLPKLPNDLAHLPPGAPRIIDSFFLRDDGVKLHYRLEGSATGPVITFCNSLLTDLHIWNHITPHLLPQYQVLRYDARGHGLSTSGLTEPKVEDLSDDLLSLLSALNIPRIYALIGVSLGGVTALHFALHNPSRLSRLIAADCSVASGPRNTAAWETRIALARSSDSGRAELARQTVARWFLPSSLEPQCSVGAQVVQQMILETSLRGFEGAAHALCDFDLRGAISGLALPVLFVVGEKDSAMLDAMRGVSSEVPGARYTVIENAGHLPMVENPNSFWNAIEEFLK